jgi:hypothetical protein
MTCSGNRLDQIALRSQFGQQDLRSKARGEHRVSLLTPDTQPRLPMTGAGLFREMPPQIPRSISSSEKNHALRFDGILKIEFARKSPSKGQKPANSIT